MAVTYDNDTQALQNASVSSVTFSHTTSGANRAIILVFGSNLAGRHGKGSALEAKRKYGAVYGVGSGRTGNSYAIPTKDENLKVLPLGTIKKYVDEFIGYAKSNPHLTFNVVRIGCGLAGYSDTDIGPLFNESPNNCHIPDEWRRYIKRTS